MTPHISDTDSNDPHELDAPATPAQETRVPWVPTTDDPSDVLATFDTISRRLGELADELLPDDDDGPRAA